MSQLREPGFDRVVAWVLRVGAFGCFFIMLAGLLVGFSFQAAFRKKLNAPACC